MKLEYRYGQVYYSDLHPGNMISMLDGNYRILTENDIDGDGNLKQSLNQISNNLEFIKKNLKSLGCKTVEIIRKKSDGVQKYERGEK